MREFEHDTQSRFLRLTGENASAFLARVSPLLPSFPPEVLESWFYPHNMEAVQGLSWMGLEQMRFRSEVWDTDRIIDDVAHEGDGIDIEFEKCCESAAYRTSYPVLKFMNDHGTWPSAPIVLDNTLNLSWPDNRPFHRFHLLDGVHRLGGLRALRAKFFPTDPAAHHRLWLVTL